MRDLMRILMTSLMALVFVACGPDEEGDEPAEDTGADVTEDVGGTEDTGEADGGETDGGEADAAEDVTADVVEDAAADGGTTEDAGPVEDATTTDADGPEDSGTEDADDLDASVPDVDGGDTTETDLSCENDEDCLEGEVCACDEETVECVCVPAPPEGDPDPAPDAGDGG